MRDVGGVGGALVQDAEQFGQGGVELGGQRLLDASGDVGQVAQLGHDGGRGGAGDGGPEPGGEDDRQCELGLPGDLPALFEGAGSAHRRGGAPADAEDAQAAQQHRLGPVGVLAQVEGEDLRRGAQGQPGRLGQPAQVGLQWHHRGLGGNLAQFLADHEVTRHPVQGLVASLAEDGERGLLDLFQPGQRASAHHGQGLGEPGRLDGVGRGDRQIVVAQHLGDGGHPALDDRVGAGEQVVVPAGGVDAGAVAGGEREPRMRPGNPGGGDLRLRQPAQDGRVSRGRRQLPAERRGVPGAADHGHPLGRLRGLAERLAHRGLAALLGELCLLGDRTELRRPQLRHRLGERVERIAVSARLDDILPPPLRVVVAGGAREHGDRVGAQVRFGRVVCFREIPAFQGMTREVAGVTMVREVIRWQFVVEILRFVLVVVRGDQAVRRREVAEAHLAAVADGPREGLPLGAELGERPEAGSLWGGLVVGQQRHRRNQAASDPFNQYVSFGRALDQDELRVLRRQGADDRPGRARSVVPDAEHPQGWLRGLDGIVHRRSRAAR